MDFVANARTTKPWCDNEHGTDPKNNNKYKHASEPVRFGGLVTGH